MSTIQQNVFKTTVTAPGQLKSVLTVGQGPSGPPGPPSGGQPIEFSINNVSSYDAAHPFLYPPDVVLLDASGNVVDTDIHHTSGHVVLVFAQPFTGTLYLS